jgi:hypothetical protein
MIAIDTNLLVYAHRSDAPLHLAARRVLLDRVAAGEPWAIPHHAMVEFLGIVTHPRIWKTPMRMADAAEAVRVLQHAPHLHLLYDQETSLSTLLEIATEGLVAGAMIHDARIAACCLAHGVAELWSCDRDFSRFPRLRVRNPLIGT